MSTPAASNCANTRPDRDSEHYRHARVILLLTLITSVSIIAVLTKTSNGVSVGDEARFGVEAKLALTAATAPPIAGNNFAVSARLFGVPTTTSQYGGPDTYQPGPFAHLLAMPFVRGLGVSNGLWIFASLVNTASLLTICIASYRRGGVLCAIVFVCGGYLVAAITTHSLTSALNTDLVVLPSYAAFVLAWAVAKPDPILVPPLAIYLTFILQTHVAYGIAPLLTGVVALVLLRMRKAGCKAGTVRLYGVSAVLLATLWFPPFVDQVFGTGNLLRLATSSIPRTGVRGVWSGFGALFRIPSQFDPGPAQLGAPNFLTLLVILIVAVAAFKNRKRLRGHVDFLAIGGAVIAGALLFSGALPPGESTDYHLYWIGLTQGFILALAIVWSTSWLPRPSGDIRAVSFGAIAIIISATILFRSENVGSRDSLVQSASVALIPELRDKLDWDYTYNITSRGGFTAEEVANSLAANLGDSGLSIHQDPTGSADDRSLVVAIGELEFSGQGHIIAATEHHSRDDERSLLKRLASFVHLNPPVELSDEPGAAVSYLDGRVNTICPNGNSVNQLRSANIGTLANLYGHSKMKHPVLPQSLSSELTEWVSRQRLAVYLLPSQSVFNKPVFSSLQCD